MESKQLYSLETNTLLTLHPKTLTIEVRQQFSQLYYLETNEFAVLYLLAECRPRVRTYSDIISSLPNIEIASKKELMAGMTKLRSKLLSFKVKNLIVHARGKGYAISDKWLEPAECEDNKMFNNILKYFKRLSEGFARETSNNSNSYNRK